MQVLPELRAVGKLQSRLAEEHRTLQARIKAATPLLKLANEPFYRPSPINEKRLQIKQKNFLFLPQDPPFEDNTRYLLNLLNVSMAKTSLEIRTT